MRFVIPTTIALIAVSPSAFAQPKVCAARSDCPAPLRCLQNTCVDEATFLASQTEESRRDKIAFSQTEPTRGFIGFALGGVLPVVWSNVGTGGQFAMRLGVLVDGHGQFELDIGAAAIGGLSQSAAGSVDVVGTAGYLLPLSDMVSWIFRIGGGGGSLFGNNLGFSPGTVFGFGEFRIDMFGVAIKTSKNVLVEFNAPSFRMMFMPPNVGNSVMLMWVSNVTVNYLF